MSDALNNLILWKLGSHSDIGYCAGSQKFADDVLALMKQHSQLRAELAAEREKVGELEAVVTQRLGIKAENDELRLALAAAQATIARQREALDWAMEFADGAIRDGLRELGGESISDETHREAERYWKSEAKTLDEHRSALAQPANLGVLHEDRAKECERLAEFIACDMTPTQMHDDLERQAAAHRARKEGVMELKQLDEWYSERANHAVALKVPMSGIPELDAMIRESRRLDMATAGAWLLKCLTRESYIR